MGVVEEQMVRAYNFLWGGHRGFGKNHFWLIINGIGVVQGYFGTGLQNNRGSRLSLHYSKNDSKVRNGNRASYSMRSNFQSTPVEPPVSLITSL